MQYTKKRITIEAIQFKGTWDSLAEITGKFPEMEQHGMFLEEDKVTVPWFGIKTRKGTMKCSPNDYVIKGIKGEFYPCKPDIFEASYDVKPCQPAPSTTNTPAQNTIASACSVLLTTNQSLFSAPKIQQLRKL